VCLPLAAKLLRLASPRHLLGSLEDGPRSTGE
jgi:hypothetical protein